MSDVVAPIERPRIRYAKNELTRVMTALEMVDPERLETGMRVLELEEMLEDARSMAARWRQVCDVQRELMVAMSGPDPDVERVSELLRIWAVG